MHVFPSCQVLNLADLVPRIIEDHPSDSRTAILHIDGHTH
jgi:hypothetical protein